MIDFVNKISSFLFCAFNNQKIKDSFTQIPKDGRHLSKMNFPASKN